MPDEAAKAQATEQAAEQAREIVQAGQGRDADLPGELRHLPEKRVAQEIERARQEVAAQRERDKQEIELRRTYARSLLIILTLQLIAANVVFWVFAEVGKEWKLSDGVIQVWLAATVVEVVGVVTVVTRHLFPRRDTQPDGGTAGGSG